MKTNPQFVRTDKAIKQALITLLKTKPFEKITVQNILDETPVTRSTFYKHYHDKYEIAETMQEEFFESLRALRIALREDPTITPNILKISKDNREIMEALLKIHTEHVNLRKTLSEYSKEHYLSGICGDFKDIESEIFASCITSFQLSAYNSDVQNINDMHTIIISVFLRILGIPEDDEIRALLQKKATLAPIPEKKKF